MLLRRKLSAGAAKAALAAGIAAGSNQQQRKRKRHIIGVMALARSGNHAFSEKAEAMAASLAWRRLAWRGA